MYLAPRRPVPAAKSASPRADREKPPVSVRHQESCHCALWRKENREHPSEVDLAYLLQRLFKRGSSTCAFSHLLQVVRRAQADAGLAAAFARSSADSLIVSGLIAERMLTAQCDALFCLAEALLLPAVLQAPRWRGLGGSEALWGKCGELIGDMRAPPEVVVPVLRLVAGAGEEGLLEEAPAPPGKVLGWQAAPLAPWIVMHLQASSEGAAARAERGPLRRACAAALAACARMRPSPRSSPTRTVTAPARLLLRCLEVGGASDEALLTSACEALRRMARHGLMSRAASPCSPASPPSATAPARPCTPAPAPPAGPPTPPPASPPPPGPALALAAAHVASVAACARGDRPDLFAGRGLPARLAALVARAPHAAAAEACALLGAALRERPARSWAAWAQPVRAALAAEPGCLPRVASLLGSGDPAAQRAAARLLRRAVAGTRRRRRRRRRRTRCGRWRRRCSGPGATRSSAGRRRGPALLAALHAAASFPPEAAEATAQSLVRCAAAAAGRDRQLRFEMGAAGLVPRVVFFLQAALGRDAALGEAAAAALLALSTENFLNQDRVLQLSCLHVLLRMAAAAPRPEPGAAPTPSQRLVGMLARRRGAWGAEWARALAAVPEAEALLLQQP
eukprot:tig00020554_g10948.t1